MYGRSLAGLSASAVLIVTACTSGGTASPSGPACHETTDAGVVAVSIADFEYKPAAIQAKVGQVIAFTNSGFEPHNATLDGGGCATRTLQTDDSDGIVFTVAGRYPIHCTVHAWITGTIAIGG